MLRCSVPTTQRPRYDPRPRGSGHCGGGGPRSPGHQGEGTTAASSSFSQSSHICCVRYHLYDAFASRRFTFKLLRPGLFRSMMLPAGGRPSGDQRCHRLRWLRVLRGRQDGPVRPHQPWRPRRHDGEAVRPPHRRPLRLQVRRRLSETHCSRSSCRCVPAADFSPL